MIGGKVKGDAGAERYGHPRQQAAGAGFRAGPRAQGFDQRRPESGPRRRKAAGRRRRTRRPGPRIAPLSARNVALLHHATTPCDLLETARLPDAVFRRLAERMQKPEEMHRSPRYSRCMKLAACLAFAIAISATASAVAAEQCRFIDARSEREACYQRQETARAARQKATESRQAEQQKTYEPMTQEDAQLAKSMRGICRGC